MAKIQTQTCPNCGSALGIPEEHERYFKCSFCGSVLEDTARNAVIDNGPQAPIQLTIATGSGFDPGQLAEYGAAAARTARRIALVAGAVVTLAMVGGVVAAVSTGTEVLNAVGEAADVTRNGDDALSGLGVSGFALGDLVASDDETAPDLVLVGNRSESPLLAYVDFDAEEPVRWTTALDGDDGSPNDLLIAGPSLLYKTNGAAIDAFNRRSGAKAFSIALPDEVQTTICEDCVRLIGPNRDVLLTLTAEGTVAAWSATDGTPRWSVRMAGTPRQLLDFGGRIAVVDQAPESPPAVVVLDETTGSPLGTLGVGCDDDFFGTQPIGVYDHLVPAPGGGFVWISDGAIAPCAQRWDPGSAGPTWTAVLPDGLSIIPGDPADVTVTEGAVVQAHQDLVLVLDFASGAVRTIAPPDVDLSLVGVRDGTVVVAATSTRGTARTTIEAFDLATGNRRWSFAPQGERVDSLPDTFVTTDAFATGFVPGGLAVVQHRAEAEELVLQVIPLDSGTASAPATFDLSFGGMLPWPSLFGFVGDDLVLASSTQLRVIDVATGDVVHAGG